MVKKSCKSAVFLRSPIRYFFKSEIAKYQFVSKRIPHVFLRLEIYDIYQEPLSNVQHQVANYMYSRSSQILNFDFENFSWSQNAKTAGAAAVSAGNLEDHQFFTS